jgi:hypothetical protein
MIDSHLALVSDMLAPITPVAEKIYPSSSGVVPQKCYQKHRAGATYFHDIEASPLPRKRTEKTMCCASQGGLVNCVELISAQPDSDSLLSLLDFKPHGCIVLSIYKSRGQ